MSKEITRKEWSAWAYYLSQIPLYLLLWPIFKVLELTGYWPRKIMSRVNREVFSWPEDLVPGAHDLVICSYFKSGTNWMMQIAVQIAWRGKAEFDHIHDLVPWPELKTRVPFAVDIKDISPEESPTGLRIIKSHYAPGDVPFNDKARYLCITRDPKSVFTSSYHFIRNTNMGPLMPSRKNWLDLYLSEETMFGTWARFAAACWALRDKPNVLFLTYEQLKDDLPGNAGRIAAFMGVDLTDAELASVVEQASFEHMKSIEYKFDAIGIGPPWVDPHGGMIRKGAGKNTEELVPGCNRLIDEFCRNQLNELHSDFPYDNFYGG